MIECGLDPLQFIRVRYHVATLDFRKSRAANACKFAYRMPRNPFYNAPAAQFLSCHFFSSNNFLVRRMHRCRPVSLHLDNYLTGSTLFIFVPCPGNLWVTLDAMPGPKFTGA